MHKIRTLIAHDNKDFKDKIVNLIKTIDDTQIVGITEDGKETFEKIVELMPEMVFIKFDLKNMNGLEIIRGVNEKLKNLPIFNIISDRNLDNDLKEMIKIARTNVNSLIQEDEPIEKRIKSIYEEYIEYNKL